MISIKYEGGPANGTAGGASPNVQHVLYGAKGEEQLYDRTDRQDDKGRVVFVHRVTYRCGSCGKLGRIVNECGCDPNNLPTRVKNR